MCRSNRVCYLHILLQPKLDQGLHWHGRSTNSCTNNSISSSQARLSRPLQTRIPRPKPAAMFTAGHVETSISLLTGNSSCQTWTQPLKGLLTPKVRRLLERHFLSTQTGALDSLPFLFLWEGTLKKTHEQFSYSCFLSSVEPPPPPLLSRGRKVSLTNNTNSLTTAFFPLFLPFLQMDIWKALLRHAHTV